jgi:hypothetical protein
MRQRGRVAVLALLAVVLACSGCTIAPDARCLSTRPTWSLNDTQPTRARQTAAAERWDRQCTLVGILSPATSAR